MKNLYKILCLAFPLITATSSFAQVVIEEEEETETVKVKKACKANFFNSKIQYQIKGQLSLGGASPLGMPAEIRKIEDFQPRNVLGLEVNATKWINARNTLGIRVGLKFEGRGMYTQALVKNYYTQIADESGAGTKGYFTGHVITEVRNTYLTMPVLLYWKASETWNFYGGLYFSALMGKSFDGHIYDGTFREGTPIGELATFEGTAYGLYDFSDELSGFQWGSQLGTEIKVYKKLRLSLDVTFANNQIFKKDFEAISFKMHNIFGNLGIAYTF